MSGKKALADAGLAWDGPDIKQLNLGRCGTLVGTAMGGMTSFANAVEALETSGALPPLLLPPHAAADASGRACSFVCVRACA